MEERLIGGCEVGFQPRRGGMLVARGGNPGDGALPHVWVSGLGRKIFLPTDWYGFSLILDRCFPMMVDVGLKFIVSESCFFIKIEMPSSGGFFVIRSKWEIQIMILQSYEAIYEHGVMKWLGDKPPVKQARVIVTILADKEAIALSSQKQHEPSPVIAGKGSIPGDIITSVSPAEEWSCLE